MKAGLGSGVDLAPDSQAETGRSSFVAPSLEEAARLFPQLEILGSIGQGGMGAAAEVAGRRCGPENPVAGNPQGPRVRRKGDQKSVQK